MKRITAKFVTKLLTEDQMENRIKVCLEMKNCIFNDLNVIKSIVTSDKTWIFRYYPKTNPIIVMEVGKFTSSKKR